jgi:hypothetical protein
MGCQNCPDDKILEGVFYIVYTGGPPHAQFAAMQTVVDRVDHKEIIRRYQPTVHPDGRIEYKKDTPEPPAPEGYVRDERAPWTLRPIWPSCVYRMYRVQMLDDGQLKIEGICTHPQSGARLHEAITCAKCNLCAVGCAIGSLPILTRTFDAMPNPGGQPEL